MREQEPKNHGTADIDAVVTIELSDDEVARIHHDAKEYEDRAWVAAEEIVSSGRYHPALRRVVQDYLRVRKYEVCSCC